jgi:shikimate kinase
MMGESVILIGPPGAGKTTVGKDLAELLQRDFIDTDSEIEKIASKKIADIFYDEGEPYFRNLEEKVVLFSLKLKDSIISLGGGAVMSLSVEKALGNHNLVVFLDVGISAAAPRIGFNKERPMLMVNPRQQWQELMVKRRPIYQSLATLSLDTTEKSPRQIAIEIAASLNLPIIESSEETKKIVTP